MPKTHELKTWPDHFRAVAESDPAKRKTVEMRRDDRNYEVGDILHLREYDPAYGYTGVETWRLVTHILRDPAFVKEGFAALSIAPAEQIAVGDEVRHIKSTSRNHWYKTLNKGEVLEISQSGKSAYVQWYDEKGRYLHQAKYPIGNLVKITPPGAADRS